MVNFLIVIKVFCFATIIDILWVLYVSNVAKNKVYAAASISILMGAPGLFGYIEVFEHRWAAIPYLLGLGFGTIVGLKLNEKINKDQK